jgi:RimJ/RimL family protein N-acetyltransferase
VRIDCGRYLLRTVKAADASDRWAGWMSDPKNLRLVNSPPLAMTREDIVAYIKQFDQRSHLLIGIFEKQTDILAGFFRIDIDPVLQRCLLFMIGDPKYRHWFVLGEIWIPFCDFVFETLGLTTMLATVLASNRALTGFLLRRGWSLDKTAPGHVRSHADGTMLDLCFFSFSRDVWRTRKARYLATLAQTEPAGERSSADQFGGSGSPGDQNR